ncbi:hypothetical protein PSTG_14837 [Puccinia striiformis f. sp. tritici PST-78]|uniref:DUF4939 domain-containing protein n=1 Tax=Puccinia striiformis f. sp. tritici PST-78 TaxID=1165861 RepID=A0A0L0UYD2_9BASI|nr:hypothetical protein PSTG_14837 [Puccinia striiformis f. sp. tritici PST-78]
MKNDFINGYWPITTRGDKAKAFTNQAGLYMSANTAKVPTDQIKVIFCISNLTGSAITWAKPYLNMLLNDEEVKFDQFCTTFKGMSFDTKSKKPRPRKRSASWNRQNWLWQTPIKLQLTPLIWVGKS